MSSAVPYTWSPRARRCLLGALLVGLCACVGRNPRAPTATLAPATLALERAKERAAQRWDNFQTRLHPLARALVRGQGGEQQWLRDGMVELPSASCAAATRWSQPAELACSLVALDAGALAVLIMHEAGGCAEELCVEHSWVFLNGFAGPLPLPAPSRAEYRRLRADLSREDATKLWLAGFRAAGDPRVAFVLADADMEEPEQAPPLASYQSCTLAPDERELVCRATTGDVIGIHPLRGVRRLIARLGLEPAAFEDAREPVAFDARELVLHVRAQAHALCGAGPCELTARIAWPSSAPADAKWQRSERPANAGAAAQRL